MLVLLFLGWTVVARMISYYNTGEAVAKAAAPCRLPAAGYVPPLTQ